MVRILCQAQQRCLRPRNASLPLFHSYDHSVRRNSAFRIFCGTTDELARHFRCVRAYERRLDGICEYNYDIRLRLLLPRFGRMLGDD